MIPSKVGPWSVMTQARPSDVGKTIETSHATYLVLKCEPNEFGGFYVEVETIMKRSPGIAAPDVR
jgi:hypothetical protein